MCDGTSSGPVESEHLNSPVEEAASEEPGNDGRDSGSTRSKTSSQIRASVEDRLSRHAGSPVLSASTRRSRLQKLEQCEPGTSASHGPSEAPEKSTLTPSMRKKYLKELFLNNSSGLSCILSSGHSRTSSKDCEDAFNGLNDVTNISAFWALDPMEHAWLLSALDGNYDTMVEFLSEDPGLLGRKDFISGYTALHWLAKNGKDETLIRLLKHAEKEGLPVNVNLRGSGGLTPLHVAAMHNKYMIVKILIGAFSADTEIMDYNGKRAWQYLKENSPREMKELLGAWDDECTVGFLNSNNSASVAQAIEPSQENQVEMDGSKGRTRGWRFASFKRLLVTVGLLDEKS